MISHQMKFGFSMYLRHSLDFLNLYSDLFNGANKLVKYFAISYVTVSILHIIGLNVMSSMLLGESLPTFLFP